MDVRAFEERLERQEHVFTRRQVLAVGCDQGLIRRMLRRREWSIVCPGVMVDHTGEPTRLQREWTAVLYYSPAALAGWSALTRHGVKTGRDGVRVDNGIEIAVDRQRRVRALSGVRLTRVSDFDLQLLGNLSPPRVRLEHVVLDLAGGAEDEIGAVAVLADACQSRRTTAVRLLTALEQRPRLRRGRFIRRVLADIGAGTNSVLEWLYLTRVERPHRLPTAKRQRAVVQRRGGGYRDVEYLACGVIVELDGRVGHDLARDRWDDLDRDVDAAVVGNVTVRLGWRQVAEPCRTASAVGRILTARGWVGAGSSCSPRCDLRSSTVTR
jgi:hypothetical protein